MERATAAVATFVSPRYVAEWRLGKKAVGKLGWMMNKLQQVRRCTLQLAMEKMERERGRRDGKSKRK